MSDIIARNRWFTIVAVRVAASIGTVLGLILLARSLQWPTRMLGAGIILAGLYMMAVVPRSLARRWRSGAE